MQNKVSKWLKKAYRVVLVAGISVGTVWGLAKSKTFQSHTQYQNALNQTSGENEKQTASNDTDSIPYTNLDSFSPGDLIFMTHRCDKSFSISQMKKCYVHKIYKWYITATGQELRYRQSEWDSVGLLVKDKEDLRVLFYYYNQLYDISIREFFLLPFFDELSFRSIITERTGLDKLSMEYRNKIIDIYDIIGKSWPKRTKDLFRDGVDIVLNFWSRAGLSNIDVLQNSLRQTVGDLEKNTEKVLVEGFGSYSKLIKIKKP